MQVKMNYVTYHIHPCSFKMPECNIRDLDLSVDELKSALEIQCF